MKAALYREIAESFVAGVAADWEECWEWKPVRRVDIWAKEVRRIASGGPLAKGHDIPFDEAIMPHCGEPMREVDNPEVNIIVLWLGRRMGKTENICMNSIGRCVTDAPTNIISMWPVEDSRDRFSRDVVDKTIQATPDLKWRFVERKSRDSGYTIGFKRFAGGSLIINYAGSKSQTKGMAAGLVIAHEADAYPASSQGEGDPIEKLFGRAEGFPDAIKIVESTGTLARTIDQNGKIIFHSNIDKWYSRSDQRKYFCPCRVCGKGQWLKFEQIKTLPKKSGELWFYLCEECDADHGDKQWRRMVEEGEWQPTAKFKDGIRGYWINGFNSLLPKGRGFSSRLHQFAAEGARALAGDIEDRRVWVNEVKCELMPYNDEEEIEPPPYQPILDGREDYATEQSVKVPARGIIITCFTDVQSNRLEIEWRAFGRSEESWGLGHFVITGAYNDWQTWNEWRTHLQKKWEHESGMPLGLNFGLVDGGKWGDVIANVVRKINADAVPGVAQRIRVSKGVGEANAVVYRRSGQITPSWKGVHIGTWLAKEIIYERLSWFSAPEKPQDGFIHFGKCYSEEFIRQLVTEKPEKVRSKAGAEILRFKNPDGVRNEALDLVVGNLAAFRYRQRWDFETIERQIAEFKINRKPPEEESETTSVGRAGMKKW